MVFHGVGERETFPSDMSEIRVEEVLLVAWNNSSGEREKRVRVILMHLVRIYPC